MPVLDSFLLPQNSKLALWKQDETFEELLQLFKNYSGNDFNLENSLSKKRNTEKLITALLMLHLTGLQDHKIIYSPTGKPLLEESPFKFISISHSGIYTAVILSAQREVAIDVQTFSKHINAGSDYFLSATEQSEVGLETPYEWLHVYWCTKETAIKYFDISGIDFKNNLQVKINEKSKKSTALCEIFKDDKRWILKVDYQLTEDYVLAYAIQ